MTMIQAITAPITRAAIFMVLKVHPNETALEKVKELCANAAALTRAVGARDPEGNVSLTIGFGESLWTRLSPSHKPLHLAPFQAIQGAKHFAPSTEGDILFHIRAERQDLCFELATVLMAQLTGAVTLVDETQGFRYFDMRSIIGFVDGTENPAGQEIPDSTLIGEEDPYFAGGSYVIVQKYLHDMDAWNALSTEAQERVIGRKKLSDVELSDEEKPSNAHNALTVIEENGEELKILRDNMPFGRPGVGEFGTYFIGYAKAPYPIVRMLENMFIGDPVGNYDRLLDFSRALTGTLLFVPSAEMLESL